MWKLWSLAFFSRKYLWHFLGISLHLIYFTLPCPQTSSKATKGMNTNVLFLGDSLSSPARVPGKQWCLRNWSSTGKVVKQRANSVCRKKCLHCFMLSFLCGGAVIVRSQKGPWKVSSLSSCHKTGKLYVNPSKLYGTSYSYYGQSLQYIPIPVIKIFPLTFSLNLLASLWTHYFLFNPLNMKKRLISFLFTAMSSLLEENYLYSFQSCFS